MKNIKTLILIGLFSLFGWSLKGQWVQKTSFGGSARAGSTAFGLGSKVYLFGGTDNFPTKDLWEYDIATDTWSQKNDFPGGFRSGATTFTINGKAYLGLGSNTNLYYNDLWEYDQANDTWTQKANFPGDGREEAVGFNVGGKGYIGTGQKFVMGPNSSFTAVYNDFYEYDPATDSWTQKASVPGSSRTYATGCGIGTKGYLGFGGDGDQTVSFTDFYEYDPIADTWTAKSIGAGYPVADAGMFAVGTDLFLLGGIDFSNFTAPTSYRKYNSITDTWSTAGNFPGGIIAGEVAVAANGKGYAGTGFDSNLSPRNDWYELTVSSNTLTTGVEEKSSIAQAFSIGPNPVTDNMTVRIQNRKNIDYYFTVTNILGEEVFSGSLTNRSSGEEKIILPSNLSKGIYTFTLINSNKTKVSSKKLIKE